jgi:succinate dehydrogenase / fumarate reductase cytochrome b subunit|tara:strand:+ start:273 stop:662 length:390 start_codon:yes stop_codon:yes gene_type:complete
MTNIKDKNIERPLSPHLQIYHPSFSMIMSISHRITGAVLYLGIFFLLLWYFSIFFGAETFNLVSTILSTQLSKITLFFFVWIFFHHMYGGIRHFIWDFGLGFDIRSVDILAFLTLALSLSSTILTFIYF